MAHYRPRSGGADRGRPENTGHVPPSRREGQGGRKGDNRGKIGAFYIQARGRDGKIRACRLNPLYLLCTFIVPFLSIPK